MTRRRVLCLVGPTASGKTALAFALAARLPVEIVSADSRQVYRGLDVGTGKPTAAEQARVLHHGIDLIEPTATWDAGRFTTMARAAIAAAHARGRHALVVGGTGLYVRALRRGLAPAPPRWPAVRRVLQRLAAQDAALLHRWVARLDGPTAARVHRNDDVRLIRAIEVALGTGRPLSWWQAQHTAPPPWETRVVARAVPTAALDARIAARVDAMCAAGWIDEVANLRVRVPDDAPAWRTVGYREWRTYLEGRLDRDAARAEVVRATRRYAKRQRTWFRAEPDVEWHDGDDEALLAPLVAWLDEAAP